MFDRIAHRYDVANLLMSGGIDRRWRQQAVRALGDHLPSGPLLDLCAGTLDLAALLEQTFPQREIIAADFSSPMLQQGLARGITRRTRTVVADAMQLPFRDHSFAGTTVAFGIRNVADTSAALSELRRVTMPGGRIVILEFFRPTRWTSKLFHTAYGRVVLPAVGSWVVHDEDAYSYLYKSMAGFLSLEEFNHAVSHAGFARVQARDLFFGVASLVTAEVPT